MENTKLIEENCTEHVYAETVHFSRTNLLQTLSLTFLKFYFITRLLLIFSLIYKDLLVVLFRYKPQK